MVHQLNSFDQLLEELSMIKVDNKYFGPMRAEYVQCNGPGLFETIQDSHPFPKLRQAPMTKEEM